MTTQQNVPTPAYITKAHYVDNHDGDTIKLKIVRELSIRLKDIDVFELKETNGKEARDFVKNELSQAKNITVVIPTNDEIPIMDINSFGRIVGEIYYDGKSLKEELIKRGFSKPRV